MYIELEVNYYYSDELTSDPEGNLVQLCRVCAERGPAMWADRGDDDPEQLCELCDKPQERLDSPRSVSARL